MVVIVCIFRSNYGNSTRKILFDIFEHRYNINLFLEQSTIG